MFAFLLTKQTDGLKLRCVLSLPLCPASPFLAIFLSLLPLLAAKVYKKRKGACQLLGAAHVLQLSINYNVTARRLCACLSLCASAYACMNVCLYLCVTGTWTLFEFLNCSLLWLPVLATWLSAPLNREPWTLTPSFPLPLPPRLIVNEVRLSGRKLKFACKEQM